MAENFDDLTTAITELKTEVADIGVHMDELFKDLNDALGSGNQAAVDAATADIRAEIQKLKDIETRDPVPATPPPPVP